MTFSIKDFFINVIKSAVSCRFGHINEEILSGKLHFLCSEQNEIMMLGFIIHCNFSKKLHMKVDPESPAL